MASRMEDAHQAAPPDARRTGDSSLPHVLCALSESGLAIGAAFVATLVIAAFALHPRIVRRCKRTLLRLFPTSAAPASEGAAKAPPHRHERAGADAPHELLARVADSLAATDAAAQAQVAPDRRPKGVLRRPRSVTFAPELEEVVEIDIDGEWEGAENDRRDRAEEPLPARPEETGAAIGAILCDETGRNGVDVSAAFSRDEDGDKCFVLLWGGDVVLDLKVRLLEFVRDDDAHVLWFTADQRQTSREHPIWTIWPHDLKTYARLLAGLEEVPDCCCVAVDACSVKSASRCRRMAARANGFVY
jgi:hypothetical protein